MPTNTDSANTATLRTFKPEHEAIFDFVNGDVGFVLADGQGGFRWVYTDSCEDDRDPLKFGLGLESFDAAREALLAFGHTFGPTWDE